MAGHSKKGLKTHARIAFADESGISERPAVRRTWAPRGQTPVIVSTGSWQVRSVIGAIVCGADGGNPKFYLAIVAGAAHKEDDAGFLKQLRRHERGRLMLLWDNLAGHKSRLVRDTAREKRIALHYFPAYAPELNPVEYAWAAAKNRDLANLRPEGLEKLDGHIRRMKRRLQRRADILRGFLRKSSLYC
jgi:transposase